MTSNEQKYSAGPVGAEPAEGAKNPGRVDCLFDCSTNEGANQ